MKFNFRFSLLVFVSCNTTSTSTASPRFSLNHKHLPGWLSHVNEEVLERYWALAEERHKQAVETALQNYDVEGPLGQHLSEDYLQEEQRLVESRRFNTFRIEASGRLPDFHEQLGDQPVFVTRRETPLFSRDECKQAITIAEDHFGDHPWPKLPSGQYFIQGCWIKDIPHLRQWFVQHCKTRLFPLLKRQFPDFVSSEEDLVVDQAYLFKYVPEPGLRTEIHTDAGCLSFTFALNSIEDYEGGGTCIEGLVPINDEDNATISDVIEMDAGQCTVRPGGIRHCGNPLVSGTRYIIGGFCMSKSHVEPVRQFMNKKCSDDAQTTKESLECAIAMNPEFDGCYPTLANCYDEEGKDAEAQAVLEDCLAIANPKSTTASYYLGTIYYKKCMYEKAKSCMEVCLQVDPSDGDAMGTLAQIHTKLGQHKAERRMYERIIQAPGVSNRILSNAYCNLGNMNEGNEIEIEHYKKSLELKDDNIPALHSLGSVYATRNNWEHALECFRKVVDLSGSESESDQAESLKLLYRAATVVSKTQLGSGDATREQILELIKVLMGPENMERLVALQTR